MNQIAQNSLNKTTPTTPLSDVIHEEGFHSANTQALVLPWANGKTGKYKKGSFEKSAVRCIQQMSRLAFPFRSLSNFPNKHDGNCSWQFVKAYYQNDLGKKHQSRVGAKNIFDACSREEARQVQNH